MTEITVSNKSFFPEATATRQLVDPTVFALAMIGGPLIVGVLGAPLLLIPSFAALLGGPIYLVAGVPVMLFYMSRNTVTPDTWAWLAFVTHIALFAPIFLFTVLTKGNHDGASLFFWFGAFFAPLWGAVSGAIYGKFERDFYKQTI
ncbi:hypothetical protein [Pseudophaeobacter leonis]|uniref:hypothetical protein n=1 Tax=Pseudophaeobacter leonis TaxID=1144477 RepID=UPI0009F518B7|nr:hypothetical protein [Pseudophaeobacter leonis]